LGVILFFGGGPKHDRLGFRYWQKPGAFVPFAASGTTGNFLAFWTSLVRSGFAFVLGPELVTIAAGESEAPRRNIPKAGRRFIYRLIVFYILGAFVISVIVASDDPDLLQAVKSESKDAGASPFVVGIKRAGIKGLDHVINGVILTSAWSSGNSFVFAGSRSLYSLALTGQAPKILRTCNRHGVPYLAVIATALLACLVYLSVSAGSASVFTWFLNLTTISGYIAWIVLLMTYLVCHAKLTAPFISPMNSLDINS
jgi:amino acid transporter